MIRRLIGLTPAIPLVLAPVAFADDKKKSIYDDTIGTNLPGTTEKPVEVDNAVTNLEAKFDDKFHPETINANGFLLTYNETLKNFVAASRVHLAHLYDQASVATTNAANSVFRKERDVTDTLESLHDSREDLLPASIYVLVAALSGSIVSRRRNIFVRMATPLLFGTGAFAFFLPKTYANAKAYVYQVEKERAPRLAEAQDKAQAQLEKASVDAKKAVVQSESYVKRGVSNARVAIEHLTGLDFSGKANK